MVKPSVVTREDVGSDPIYRPIGESSSGRTADSDSVNPGSNPGSPAIYARVVELEDTTGLGPVALVRGGSSPSSGTIHGNIAQWQSN